MTNKDNKTKAEGTEEVSFDGVPSDTPATGDKDGEEGTEEEEESNDDQDSAE